MPNNTKNTLILASEASKTLDNGKVLKKARLLYEGSEEDNFDINQPFTIEIDNQEDVLRQLKHFVFLSSKLEYNESLAFLKDFLFLKGEDGLEFYFRNLDPLSFEQFLLNADWVDIKNFTSIFNQILFKTDDRFMQFSFANGKPQFEPFKADDYFQQPIEESEVENEHLRNLRDIHIKKIIAKIQKGKDTIAEEDNQIGEVNALKYAAIHGFPYSQKK